MADGDGCDGVCQIAAAVGVMVDLLAGALPKTEKREERERLTKNFILLLLPCF